MTSPSRTRYSGTCGMRACPTYSPWANSCQGIMPRASQPTSPQPHPDALSTPQIGYGAAGVNGWQNWAVADDAVITTTIARHSAAAKLVILREPARVILREPKRPKD